MTIFDVATREHDTTAATVYDPVRSSEEVKELIRGARSENTRRVYASAWRAFDAWCAASGLVAVGASVEVVSHFLNDMAKAGKAPGTVNSALAAISHWHRHAGHAFDTTRFEGVIDGIRCKHKRKPVKSAPATVAAMTPALDNMGNDIRAVRDRAIILLGYWAARRRSEIAGLDIGEISGDATGRVEITSQGLVIELFKSKTNQHGDVERYAIGHGATPCAVEAVQAWIDAAGITDGPLFRKIDKHGVVGKTRLGDHSINAVVKARLGKGYTGHALRGGFMTDGAHEGLTTLELMRQSGHKSPEMAAAYVNNAELFRNNIAVKLSKRMGGK